MRSAGGYCATCRGSGDTDFTVAKLIARANDDLANGIGNLISRVVSLAHCYRDGAVRPCGRPEGTSRWLAAAADAYGRRASAVPDAVLSRPAAARQTGRTMRAALREAVERTPAAVRAALDRFDFRAAASAVFGIVEEANRYVDATEPWHLGRAERTGDVAAGERLDQVLGALVTACQVLAAEIWPFLPDLAEGSQPRATTPVAGCPGRDRCSRASSSPQLCRPDRSILPDTARRRARSHSAE